VQTLGTGALLAPSLPDVFAAQSTSASEPHGLARPQPATLRTFSLANVSLLPGPFLDAQRRDEKYLLQLDPDRMMHNFHVNAGLTPKAPVYGGWESQEPWVEIRCHGHTLGHYLSACALMFETTSTAAFKDRVDYIVRELHACQEAGKSGLICAFPDAGKQLELSVQGREFLGVPWYTMHKIFAGLRDAHIHAGNDQALTVLARLADWAATLTAPLSQEQMQRMLEREHGGMNEILGDVYSLTGDIKYLRLAQRFSHRALLQPLSEGRDTLDGLHSNTQIPKVIGFHRLYELTGDEAQRRAAEFFWRTIIDNRTYATGGNGDIEHFFPPQEFAQRLQSAKTMETCCMHNMLRLTRALFVHTPTTMYADYYERTLYNGILASQDPASGMTTYFQATRPGYVKLYHTPIDSFWCCTGSGLENHAKYGDSIYFGDDESLYVNLFIASTLDWREKNIRLTQTTHFPESATTRFTINAGAPTQFALKIRHPAWCGAVTVSINGGEPTIYRDPARYLHIARSWRDGDHVEVQLPMHLHTKPLPSSDDIVALLYGPLVLAGRLGTAGLSPGADIIMNERQSGEMLQLARAIPTLTLDPQRPAAGMTPTERPLSFIAHGVDGDNTVELIPYFQIAHERYNLYWNIG